MQKYNHFETLQLHAGQEMDGATKSRAVPIYQTTAYGFDDADQGADIFAMKTPGNIYTRIMNPTNDVLEKRIAALDGGVGGLAFASGAAAIAASIYTIAKNGDEIVSASTIYGGTYNFFKTILPRSGITTRFVDCDNLGEIRAAINGKTKAVYVETIGNPTAGVADIGAIAEIAHAEGIMLIVDSTFTTPYLMRPIDFGADVVVHSATKFIGGHGTSMGGLVVDAGKFDYAASGRYPDLTEPDESAHGMRYAFDCAPAGYITKMRMQILRDMGACLSPFNAFLLLQGMETLSLRMERYCYNGLRVAQYLEGHPKVERVNYPSLEGSKYYELSKKYLPRGAGSIFSFEIKGGIEAGKKFINSLELFTLLANVADAKSLVIHPASTTHAQMSPEELIGAGISEGLIRLSVGLEHVDDVLADLEQAFDRV